MSIHHHLTPEVKEALKKCTFEGNTMFLPKERLVHYDQMKKAVELLGGKYKVGSKFVFKTDAKPIIDAALDDGKVVKQKQATQFFATPKELAEQLAAHLGVEPHHRILEPSAGTGALIDALFTENDPYDHRIHVIELDQERRDGLHRKYGKKIEIMGAEFLSTELKPVYDRILMNPPFTKDQDIIHIQRAFDLLKKGGKLVAVCSPGFSWKDNKRYADFRSFVAHNGFATQLPSGSFKSSGTDIETFMIELDK